jgi:DNA-binding transcriptional ArsR family regulator
VFDAFVYRFPGDFSGGATPDPIPNSVVKPTRADGTNAARHWESRSLPGFFLLKYNLKTASVLFCIGFLSSYARASELTLGSIPQTSAQWHTSVLYQQRKITDDFERRGKADFKANAVGFLVSYAVGDRSSVCFQGGSLIGVEQSSQGSTWRGRSGFFYGAAFDNDCSWPLENFRQLFQTSIL